MKETDYENFNECLRDIAQVYNAPMTSHVMALYWQALKDRELSDVMKAMSQHLRENKFFPKPAEIIELIQGKRDYYSAFKEAAINAGRIEPDWKTPAAYWAAQEFGFFDLKTLTWEQAKTRWVECMDRALSQPLKPIPPKRQSLPEPGKTHRSEVAKECMAKIRAMLAPKFQFEEKPENERGAA